jgi:hypothetical protein
MADVNQHRSLQNTLLTGAPVLTWNLVVLF